MSLFTTFFHRIGTPLPLPPVPPHITAVANSCLIATHRARLWGGPYAYIPMEQTCSRQGSRGEGG